MSTDAEHLEAFNEIRKAVDLMSSKDKIMQCYKELYDIIDRYGDDGYYALALAGAAAAATPIGEPPL